MNVESNYKKNDASTTVSTSAPRYVCPIKPMSTPLVMVLIAGTVLLVLIIALQVGSAMLPFN